MSRGRSIVRLVWRTMASAIVLLIPIFAWTEVGNSETAANKHLLVIRGFEYLPGTRTVRSGDTLVWRNEDVVPHTATEERKGLSSGSIAAGEAWTFVARHKGTYRYTCAFHPSMKGTLIVR